VNQRTAMPLGFTLIELLVTLAIMAMLATIVVPSAQVMLQRQREQELRLALRELRGAIDAYRQAVTEGHVLRKIDETGYPKSLAQLVEGVEDASNPKHAKLYFLRRIPRDPFCRAPAMSNEECWGLRSYASEANDPQPGSDVYDVHSLSTGTGLNGQPYRTW
jgi:general secretion pathway protein G